MLTVPIYIGVSHDVTYDSATLAADASSLDAGTGTWDLFDAAKATSLANGVLSRAGNSYAGTIPATLTATLTAKTGYWVKITFTQNGNTDVRWIPCKADYRSDM